jgi:hypothetical protein
MNRITVDASIVAKLGGLNEPLALVDETGKVLGVFRPARAPERGREVDLSISEEEWQRRERERSYTTAEVLEYLDRLGNP